MPPDALRQTILNETASARAAGRFGKWLRRERARFRESPLTALASLAFRSAQKTVYFVLAPVTIWTYARHGIDLRSAVLRYVYRLLGKTPEQRLSQVVRIRTGEDFARAHDIDAIVQMTLDSLRVGPR